MVAYDQNSNCVTGNTKQEMIRETSQVGSANIALADRERLRSLSGLSHELL